MQNGYFLMAWNDLRSVKNWVGKMLLLGLLLLIPVFGGVVLLGYAGNWAREIAWNVNRPLPASIFKDEENRLIPIGLSMFVLVVVFSAVPLLVTGVFNILFVQGSDSLIGWAGIEGALASFITGTVDALVLALYYVLAVVTIPFVLVGWMRIAIYGRLSAGFQFKNLWAMLRREFSGILRIVGMVLLGVLVAGCVVALVFSLFGFIGFGYALLLWVSGSWVGSFDMIGEAVPVFIVACIFVVYLLAAFGAFVLIMVMRAMGYWTRRFDVPHWRGQDDPMPFEVPRSDLV